MATISPNVVEKSPRLTLQPQRAVVAPTASMGTTYIPPPASPEPPQGKNLKHIKLGKLHLFQPGIARKGPVTTGFLAQPLLFRGFKFPAGTWVELNGSTPRSALLTSFAHISDMDFPIHTKFDFSPGSTYASARTSIQWQRHYFFMIEFSLTGQPQFAGLAGPMELPIGSIPSMSGLEYDAQGRLTTIQLAQDAVLQDIEFANATIVPKGGFRRLSRCAEDLDLPSSNYDKYTAIPTPIFLHPNGQIMSGVVRNDTSIGDQVIPNGTRVYFDLEGGLSRATFSESGR